MPEAYIATALRTAGGRRHGALSGWHPADLLGAVLDRLVDTSGIDPAAIEDVIVGCVAQTGEQGIHVGRNAVLSSSLPESVPAVTIDRQCGSSQQAVQFAAQAVLSGTQDVVIAAGVESMSRVPMGSTGAWNDRFTPGGPLGRKLAERYPGIIFSQFSGAERLAAKHGLDREALDAFALESHRRGAAAARAGAFDEEIVPIPIGDGADGKRLHIVDEGIRFDASLNGIGAVRTLVDGGCITAANASQICDGASAVLIVSERALTEHGLTPLARIHSFAVTGGDPVLMLEEPLFATDKVLHRSGLSIDDIDLYEVNEAFAPVPLAWLRHTGGDLDKLNVNGGAIALGHPLGASGTKLLATLVHALRARRKKYGLQTMCEGGGLANALIVEAF